MTRTQKTRAFDLVAQEQDQEDKTARTESSIRKIKP
jgi:hypothetical protein